jgi:cytochrome c553
MNLVTCPECGVDNHRADYRKRGGGLYTICKRCRENKRKNTWKARQKLTEVRKAYTEDALAQYKHDTSKALVSEFKKVTRQNRNRIKVLEANKKPTHATKMWLNKRLALQQMWIDALHTLLNQLHQNKKVPTLREYMENGIQNADYHAGFRDIL